jgi:hypothetical protein
MRQQVRAALLILGLLLLIFAVAAYKPKFSNNIVDVSWPNCALKGTNSFSSGIVGATGGLDFKPNPCAGQEAGWFSRYSLYMNTGYPGRAYGLKYLSTPLTCRPSNNDCLAYNYGYNAAKYAVSYADYQAAHSNVWWLDVETDNSWTLSPLVNRNVLAGAIAAVKQIPFVSSIGIYSTPNQWRAITGSWHNLLPEWIGTGSSSRNTALQACSSKSFTGGPIWLSQYTIKLDTDLACPNG